MPITEQDYAEELQQLVFNHSIPAHYADDLVAETSNQCAVELIHEIEQENKSRKRRKLRAISIPAKFRQSIRKRKAQFREALLNEQADLEREEYERIVEEQHAAGFRPNEDRLVKGIVTVRDDPESDLTDEEYTRTLKFIVSLRQEKKVETAKSSG